MKLFTPLCLLALLTGSCISYKEKVFLARNKTWPEDSYHGYLPVNRKSRDYIFYWFFPSRKYPTTDPLIIWLTGGPGCSSSVAVLKENGPFLLSDAGEPVINKYSWNNKANIIYVDSPIGTGFSIAGEKKDRATGEEQIATNLYEFMLEFLQKFPDLQGRAFYITGESYAGKYIPWFSNHVVTQNAKLDKSSKLKINLKGIMIGNGMVNPEWQYPAYFNFSSHHQLITIPDQQKLAPAFQFCHGLLRNGATEQAYNYCETLINALLVNPITGRFKFNYYNITLPCITQNCYDDSKLIKFMRSEEVKNVLEQRGENWKECKDDIYLRLMADQPINAAQKLVDVLEAGVQVMGYYGELDFICNWEGGLSWMNN